MTDKPKSKRQLAFDALDNMAGVPRQEAAKALMDYLGVSHPYALTLFQTHRQDRSKEVGDSGYVTIYKVRDTRSNSGTKPYMSSMVKNNPLDKEPRTKEDAVTQYIEYTKNQIKLAMKLVDF